MHSFFSVRLIYIYKYIPSCTKAVGGILSFRSKKYEAALA